MVINLLRSLFLVVQVWTERKDQLQETTVARNKRGCGGCDPKLGP